MSGFTFLCVGAVDLVFRPSFCWLPASLYDNFLTVQVEIADEEQYMFDNDPILKAEELGKPSIVSIRYRPDYFIFKVESTGCLNAYNIVVSAIDILMEKLNKIKCDTEGIHDL